jgi:hypothetical protein
MKKIIVLLCVTLALLSFTIKPDVNYKSSKETTTYKNTNEGKAWWCSYYTKNKTMYITKVYNNDCNHCQNEIAESLKKWLILNDYDHQVSTVNIISIHDVDEASLTERRTEKILERKQKGYNVIYIGFTYTAN